MATPDKEEQPEYPVPDGYWPPPGIENLILEQDRTAIFMQVGYALYWWETIEEEMQSLAVQIVGGHQASLEYPLAMYGSIESNGGRIRALECVADVRFRQRSATKRQRRPFHNLMRHLREASRIRNDIAHGIIRDYMSIMRYKAGGPEEGKEHAGRCILVAPTYAYQKQNYQSERWSFRDGELVPLDLSRNVYSSRDMYSFAEKFRQLCNDLRQYAQALRAENESSTEATRST